MACFNFKSPFRLLAGASRKRRQKDCEDVLVNKVNVDEEYKEALRTKSYTDISSKVEGHLASKRMETSSSFPLHLHLFESLLEPGQETVAHIIEGSNFHPLLIDYFKITIETCSICEILLQSIHQIRANHRMIKSVLDLRQKACVSISESSFSNDECYVMFRDLASFATIRNPLSAIRPVEFRNMQTGHSDLLSRLTLQCRKIQRRIKIKRGMKKVVGYTIVVAYTALTFTLMALAFHTIVGFVAAPALFTCSLGLLKKHNKLVKIKASSRERIVAQLDVAAKGVYILMNDFNTISRLVMRLHDEIEHSKAMADMCVRNGKIEVMKEVIREFRIGETCLNEQLKELEEHINLCFLTINRSRRLVVQELMHGATPFKL
ncbi:Single hybrid motif superfamily protein [Heracleum sosnowskyi]|uniref:Single hybrid motif superfamily protein n=1 Tax=Heracleum sosnowskyi TaxID=360622 RepID=A0AAD8N8A5_9APIA|nr:Single hybrid motif superfamily protein [Heracleum sosnowskyi]